ncbi:tRNA lysidine(34) synthetase TilS [Ruminococcus flavefaciens]|uniref:tRNA lysidine(34) synthetase TilS n=1 Tax=Ruminococcus flavefaciens TaxID=1265 RepID=UPI00068519E9|nr:tRNA lysidine(34) synthetase TilS [Ruminococcus flavefaciens]
MMLAKVYKFITENNMLSSGDTVVCGLSGGADSVALLLSLYQLREKLGISVEALHVNHCIRGKESDGDEEFCRELCKSLDIAFTAVRCDVISQSKIWQRSTEETARIMRYEEFAKHSEGKKLATAHNANDNLETVILNLTRGTGIKGLAGIPCTRENIIRPLLTVTRAEIEEFLSVSGQNYVTDSTNLSDDYTRNKIRHKIIPLLEEINSSVVATSVNTLETVREENAVIEADTDAAMKKCRHVNSLNGLSEYPPVIRKRCISRLLSENKLPYSHQRLEDADNVLMNGGKLNISRNIYLTAENGSVSLGTITDEAEIVVEMPLQLGDNIICDNCTVRCDLFECDNLKKIEAVHKKSTFYLLDYDKIRGRLIVRTRKYGDRIRLKGRNFTSSIKKLINEKIPPEKRNGLLFIEDEEGTILAESLGIADRIAPESNTARFLEISFIRS